MNSRAQRGTIDNAPVLWCLLIIGAVAFYNWPGAREMVNFAVVGWIAGGLVLLFIVLGVLAHRADARHIAHLRELARAMGSELTTESRTAFGRTTTHHTASYRRAGRTVSVQFAGGAIYASLDAPGGADAWFSVKAEDGGGPVVQRGEKDTRSGLFLDERVRANLASMARIGKDRYRPVIATVTPGSVTICKYGEMTAREALLFLNLCWPVFDRALAACFDAPVEPPSKVCANCGGECCATCDSDHQPGCGCASMAIA